MFNIFISFSKTRYTQVRCVHEWVKPQGVDTGIKVYNCISKSKEPLIVNKSNYLKWYTCGPTVYDSAHIGHASCYMKLDIIQKILKNYFKLNLVTVMNVTDIDDKIIKKATEMKTDFKVIANKYEKEFWQDLKDLGIARPEIVIRVTENMQHIINFITKLLESGFAYKAVDNSVYFDVESYNNYGKLQAFGREEIEKKKSLIKKSILDFALWKNSNEGEPSWSSPWGNGRPGWHIECSTLASHLLGSNIDIHAGGIDLRFPHHENEEAQSCAYHKTSQWVNYWIHTGHLSKKNSEKMSKSLKNTISIQDMLKETTPETFRMACIMSTYKSNMEYGVELLTTAKNTYKLYQNFIDSCIAFRKGLLKSTINQEILMKHFEEAFKEINIALCDDFNTPKVLKILNELIAVTNSMLYSTENMKENSNISSVILIQNLVQETLNIFGINFDTKSVQSQDFIDLMNVFNDFRLHVRTLGLNQKHSDILKLCDDARNNLREIGIVVKDFKNTSYWNKST